MSSVVIMPRQTHSDVFAKKDTDRPIQTIYTYTHMHRQDYENSQTGQAENIAANVSQKKIY